MKNEVKKKMNIDSRKLRHQSHDERVLMTKVNQIFFFDAFSLSKFSFFNPSSSFSFDRQTDCDRRAVLAIGSPSPRYDEKLFPSRNIYNEASETFAGA